MSPPGFGHPMNFANTGNAQEFHHGLPQAGFMPPMFPSGIPQPQYMRQYQPHPGYPQPISMMPNPYGLLAYGGPANPASVPNQQVPMASLGPPPTAALQPQPAPMTPALQPQPAPKNRPNREVRPGVFAFQIDVLDGEQSKTFHADTDILWAKFRNHVVRILGDPHRVQLSGKIVGEGKWGILDGAEGLGALMQRLVQKAYNARTKAVALEVKNKEAPTSSKKSKSKGKRSRKEDRPLPPMESDDEDNSQLTAYKQLSDETRCEAHHGHCHITRQGGSNNHYRLSHQEMTLWAKKMTLNEATKYAPPHCLNIDRGATLKSGRRTASASSVPDVHVTIQNIAPDGSSFPSAGPSVVSSTTSSNVASPSSVISQNHVTAAISHPSPPDSAPSAPPLMYQLSYTPPISAPFRSTSASPSTLSWGAPIPAVHGQNIFPPLSSVMTLLTSERPGTCWNQLAEFLWEAGVNSSEHILLADPTVLALVGNMGTRQATVLRNYAKRVVLPVLGLKGTYQEDENDEDLTSTAPTHKRPLDLGESVVYGIYKKPKINDADRTPETPPYEPDLDIYLVDDWDPSFKVDEVVGDDDSDEEGDSDEEDELYSENDEDEE